MKYKPFYEKINMFSEKEGNTFRFKFDLSEPPCKECKYFKPQAVFILDRSRLTFDGCDICHATEMFGDFSCFVEKE